jgi:hypothetical protein
MALATQVGAVCLVATLIAGPGPGAVLLVIGGVAVAFGSWVRANRRLRSPQSPISVRLMVIGRLGPVVAIAITALGGAGGGGSGATAIALAEIGTSLLLLQAAIIARESTALADWSRDDRAAGLGDLAFTIAMFTVIAWLAVQLGRLIGDLTAVPIFEVDGLARAGGVVISLGALCWWLIRTLADAKLLGAVMLCLAHRIDHDAVDDRRHDRDEAWQEELDARLHDDRGGEA